MQVHLDNPALVTDELVEYIYQNHIGHLDHEEARRKSVSVHDDHGSALLNITASTLIIFGIAARNRINNSLLVVLNKCGHWPPYEHPQAYTTQGLTFLQRL